MMESKIIIDKHFDISELLIQLFNLIKVAAVST